MIDVESDIYDPIAAELLEAFPGISVSSEYVRAPSKIPHVSIVESDNYMTVQHLDSSDEEKFSTIMFEVNAYSNKVGEKKTECRDIMKVVDRMMYAFNFVRLSMTPVPNLENATIYRITARYRAETDGTNMFRI